jgi:uncharacterized membrane protein YraQ (UPF0718 family)
MELILRALSMAFAMGWEILWPLILGFTLSAVVEAVVSHREMARLLPDDRSRSIATALALGAASSSCSYAAVALARSLFRKGANFTAAMAFEMASTNLVLELSIIMLVFLGWQFMLAEMIGAPIMVALLVLLFRSFLTPKLLSEAKEQADKGIMGRMEGHAEMDMSVSEGGSLWQRITSEQGLTAISHYFVTDWASVWMDIVGGVLIAGALAAWVPPDFWQSFFLVDQPVLAKIWGPIVGPLVAVISFVCSVGNIPLAAVLWNGGISFGGVIAFIFADPTGPQHLSQILRNEDGGLPVRHLLRGDGRRGADCRSNLLPARPRPDRAQRARRRSLRRMELHELAQHHLPVARRATHLALPQDRRACDVAYDEQADRDDAGALAGVRRDAAKAGPMLRRANDATDRTFPS